MNIYQNLYDLINTYVFGNSIVVGSYEELVTILFSTLGCLALVSLPFVILIGLMVLVMRSWKW